MFAIAGGLGAGSGLVHQRWIGISDAFVLLGKFEHRFPTVIHIDISLA